MPKTNTMKKSISDNVVILNGCCIRIPDIPYTGSLTLNFGGNNRIVFSLEKRVITIEDILSSDTDTLYVMLDALSMYAYLASSTGVTCRNGVDVKTLEKVDAHGILDIIYTLDST